MLMLLLVALFSLSPQTANAKFRSVHQIEYDCAFTLRPSPETLEQKRAYISYHSFGYETQKEYDSQKDKGFTIYPYTDGPKTIHRTIELPELINPVENWPAEIWETSKGTYTFFDIGFRNMEADARQVNKLVYEHVMSHRHDRLTISYGEKRRKQVEAIRQARFTVHGRVLDAYEAEKPYLTPADMWALYMTNKISTNNDVVAIFKNDPHFKWSNQTVDSIERDLLATIQITYYGQEDYFEPTLRGFMRQTGDSAPYSTDSFPFEHRLSKEQKENFRATLFAHYRPEEACEFTRYANFVHNLPREVADRLILEALNRVLFRGIKTIFVSGDELTMRLFRRYGIEPFADLPTDTNSREILGVLDVESDLFREVYAKLSESAFRVTTREAHYRE